MEFPKAQGTDHGRAGKAVEKWGEAELPEQRQLRGINYREEGVLNDSKRCL